MRILIQVILLTKLYCPNFPDEVVHRTCTFPTELYFTTRNTSDDAPVRHKRCYLLNNKAGIRTDCQSLIFLS